MFIHTLQVRFRDLDAYNHVNNAVYLTYFEEARIAFVTAIGMRSLFSPERSTVIARAEIDYRAPARLGDQLNIEVRTGEIRNTSYELLYRIARHDDGLLIATGKTVQVCFNFTLNAPTRLPEEWRTLLRNGAAAGEGRPRPHIESDRARA